MPVQTQPVEIHVSNRALFKVFLAILLIAMAMKLAPLFMMLFMAVLVAVTLYPLTKIIQRWGAPQWVGILVIVLGLAVSAGLFFAVLLPSMAEQVSTFVKNWPKLRHEILTQAAGSNLLHPLADHFMGSEATAGQSSWMEHGLSAGQVVAGGVFQLFVVLILAVYLIVDGPNTFKWGLAFFKAQSRKKIRDTGNEVSDVVFAYVAGQVITSALVFFFALISLSILHVPAALTLSVLAGIFDVLPVLGFFLSAGPAILLALTVSPTTALIVLGLYVFYHGLESYFIVPKVYGNRLRVSTLTVILSLLAADYLAGIPGALAVLPIVASYPIIEKIWLKPLLGEETVEKHAELSDENNKEAKK